MGNGFKDKDGKFHPTDNDSSKLSSHQVENAKDESINHNQTNQLLQQKLDSRTDEAIDLVDEKYENIMSKTAFHKGGMYNNGAIEKFVGRDENNELKYARVEAICGATSTAIQKQLNKKFGKGFAEIKTGFYIGDDRVNSESYGKTEDQLRHEWVQLPDGTIIDNACGQLQEDQNIRFTKNERLRITKPTDSDYGNYREQQSCKTCLKTYKEDSCPNCD